MGITKGQLKAIVKECLVEILTEGVGNNSSTSGIAKRQPSRPSFGLQQKQKVSKVTPSLALKEAILKESGGDEIMASILADTAEKTLPAMLENEKLKPSVVTGKIENIVASHDPQDIFGEEVASKWADLAFMGSQKK